MARCKLVSEAIIARTPTKGDGKVLRFVWLMELIIMANFPRFPAAVKQQLCWRLTQNTSTINALQVVQQKKQLTFTDNIAKKKQDLNPFCQKLLNY